MKTIPFAKGLSFPIDVATETLAFIARRGAGKSYAAGKLVEGLLINRVQVVIIDPVGRHYGLRLAADGKRAGLDIVILGGLRGDIPLSPDAGSLVGDAVIDTGSNFILDVSQFSLGERKRFLTALGEKLWQRQKARIHPAPIHIVLEEAQTVLPQHIYKGDERMVGVWTEIVRLGRNFGIGISMVTQRPQSVSKEALTQAECLVVLQTNGVPEKKALKEWIVEKGADTDLLKELPFLKRGVAYIWSPSWLEHFGKHAVLAKRTFDASATPKVGDKRAQVKLKPLDLDWLKKQMSEAVKKGEESDVASLQRKVKQLEAELKEYAGRVHWPDGKSSKVIRTEVPALDKKSLQLLERGFKGTEANVKTLKAVIDRLSQTTQVVSGAMDNLKMEMKKWDERMTNGKPAHIAGPVVSSFFSGGSPMLKPHFNRNEPGFADKVRPVMKELATMMHKGGEGAGASRYPIIPKTAPTQWGGRNPPTLLPEGERKTLIAIAMYQSGVERDQLSVTTGYKRSSRDAFIQRLKTKGFITVQGGHIDATDAGRDALGNDYEPLPTGDALFQHWLSRLPEGERRVLDFVTKGPGGVRRQGVTREDIDAATGYRRSSRDAYIQRLKARQLVTTEGIFIVPSPSLFD